MTPKQASENILSNLRIYSQAQKLDPEANVPDYPTWHLNDRQQAAVSQAFVNLRNDGVI